ncbi:MAG: AsmA family protein, partial [Fimbriimonadaceae bacterium]|nr:AsmA family protein [Chitinophagales bacterium]
MQETAITSNLPQQPRRRKFLRYTFIGFGAFILFVLFSAILIPLLFEGQVKKIFLKEINKNLATEIVVDEDDIELSILKNFPEATVVFRNVAIRESIKNSKENFLHSDAISLLFNVRDILKGNYVIKKIIVQDADIRLLTDAQGNINYKFWKENESEDSSGDLSVVLEEVKCENINFIYADKKNRQDISMLIKDVTMHGNFTADTYTLKTEGDILSHGIEIRNTKYLIEKELKINTALDVNNVTDTYTFKKGVITVNKNIFEIEGSITDATELALDLEVKSSKADVEALMLLLPGNYASALKNIESKGKITFQSVIEGTYTKQKNPAVTIDFNIDDGTIYHKDFGGRLTDVNCSGTYSNGEKHAAQTSSLKINNLSAKYGKEPVSFKLIYNNFTNPFIDLQLNGNIPASILIASVAENITDAEGYIAFDNVSVKGQIKNFRSDLATEPVQGNFSFHDVACTINKEKIKINGTAQLENAEMILDNFKAEFFGSVLQASITLNNWLETIFISGSENKPPLNISGNISCDKFDLQKTIATFTSPEKQPVPASPGNITTKKQATNDWMNVSGNIRCAIDDFQYKKLQVKNVKADL